MEIPIVYLFSLYIYPGLPRIPDWLIIMSQASFPFPQNLNRCCTKKGKTEPNHTVAWKNLNQTSIFLYRPRYGADVRSGRPPDRTTRSLREGDRPNALVREENPPARTPHPPGPTGLFPANNKMKNKAQIKSLVKAQFLYVTNKHWFFCTTRLPWSFAILWKKLCSSLCFQNGAKKDKKVMAICISTIQKVAITRKFTRRWRSCHEVMVKKVLSRHIEKLGGKWRKHLKL